VGSLGVALAALAWLINWEFTNKTSSYNLPSSAFLGFDMQYYMAASLLFVTVASVALIARNRFGLRLMAVRDDEDAALELGVNSFLVKAFGLALSAFFVGVAGALLAMQKLTLEPYSALSLNFTINMIIACVIGGLGTVVGPLIGAAAMFGLQQWLEEYTDWSTLILGIALIFIIRLAPGGLWGLARSAWERATREPRVERGLRRVGARL
jgi:branched-chain amino acid transport system permease protein